MAALRDGTDVDMDTHPLFYISVSDIELLKSKRTYIACESPASLNSLTSRSQAGLHGVLVSTAGTTERILQTKEDLFDVFVMDNSLTCRTVYNEPLLRLTRQDQVRFRQLLELRSSKLARDSASAVGATDRGEGSGDEDSFARWVPILSAAPSPQSMSTGSCPYV